MLQCFGCAQAASPTQDKAAWQSALSSVEYTFHEGSVSGQSAEARGGVYLHSARCAKRIPRRKLDLLEVHHLRNSPERTSRSCFMSLYFGIKFSLIYTGLAVLNLNEFKDL